MLRVEKVIFFWLLCRVYSHNSDKRRVEGARIIRGFGFVAKVNDLRRKFDEIELKLFQEIWVREV